MLTYADAEFATAYDGEGLGRKPPSFALEGYATYSHYSYGTVLSAEDKDDKKKQRRSSKYETETL